MNNLRLIRSHTHTIKSERSPAQLSDIIINLVHPFYPTLTPYVGPNTLVKNRLFSSDASMMTVASVSRFLVLQFEDLVL